LPQGDKYSPSFFVLTLSGACRRREEDKMSSCIHYRMKSSLTTHTLSFSGTHISLAELKKLIISDKKLEKTDSFELIITNSQSKEVYKKDNDMIPKNASVIVQRKPILPASKPAPWDLAAKTPAEILRQHNAAQAVCIYHHLTVFLVVSTLYLLPFQIRTRLLRL